MKDKPGLGLFARGRFSTEERNDAPQDRSALTEIGLDMDSLQ